MRISQKIQTVLIIMVFMVSWISFSVTAAGMTVSLSGPSAVRAGDTVKVTLTINGSGLRAVLGEIRYNAAHVTYKANGGLPSGWKFDELDTGTSGKISFLVIDDKMEAPLSGSKQLFTMDFQVKPGVSAGTSIIISGEGIEGSDGSSDFTAANVSYAVSLSPPLSSNSFLSSLAVSNAGISPNFDKNVTSYTASVAFDITSLAISAVPEDSKAKAVVSGNTLKAGGTTDVLVTVTAENGSKKVYTIRVTRAQDPNYVASGNANLRSITPSIGILSPPFSPEVTRYYIYLPYEVSTFQANGEAADTKASVRADETLSLSVGNNTYTIKGVGEDSSEKGYEITVIRMPEAGGELPQATPTPEADSSEDVSSQPESSSPDSVPDGSGTPFVLIFAALAAGLLAGIAIGYFLIPGKRKD